MSDTRDILGTSRDTFQIGDAGPKISRSGANVEVRTSDLSALTNLSSLNTDAVAARRNNSGQIKANYAAGIHIVNFTAFTRQSFDINDVAATVSASPTTIYPYSSPTGTYADIFDATRGATPTGRLIENPIPGQSHTWRLQGSYANKAPNNVGALTIVIRNPVTTFEVVGVITLPEGATSGVFSVEIRTIGDGGSIPPPNGYILQAETSFTDNNFVVAITAITRFSNAVEITTAV